MGAETQTEIKGKGFGGQLALWTGEGGDLWRMGPPISIVFGEKSPFAPHELLIASAAEDTSRLWAKFLSLPS